MSTTEFREFMSHFPTGVAIVASVDASGAPRGLTCSSLASVCADPPTLLVSVRSTSPTRAAIAWRGAFSVNLLHVGGRDAAELFSSPAADRFGGVRWVRSGNGLPWLPADAAVMADCRVTGAMSVGDHTVLFGEASAFSAGGNTTPLLYGKRHFAEWNTMTAERTTS